MLDIAFRKLTGRTQKQVLARQMRPGMDKGHRILQLIAKPESASRLVGGAAGPQAARQGLVQQPAVGQHVEGWVGRFHMDRAEGVLPVLPYRFESVTRCR